MDKRGIPMRYVTQHTKPAGLGVVALAITGGAALAQDAAQAALPDITPCPEPIAAIATCYTAGHERSAVFKRRISFLVHLTTCSSESNQIRWSVRIILRLTNAIHIRIRCFAT